MHACLAAHWCVTFELFSYSLFHYTFYFCLIVETPSQQVRTFETGVQLKQCDISSQFNLWGRHRMPEINICIFCITLKPVCDKIPTNTWVMAALVKATTTGRNGNFHTSCLPPLVALTIRCLGGLTQTASLLRMYWYIVQNLVVSPLNLRRK